ncbi:MAG: CoA transferase subunit A [Eubacteriales bacterium]
MSKLMTITDAVNLIKDDMTIGIGGNVLHRSPSAFVREIVRNQKKRLKIIKTAGAFDVDMLVLGKCVYSVDAGFISYETEFGLAPFYRKAVQNGEIKANEHACYTVISALNAAKRNIPFMPVKGLKYGDLITHNDYFKIVKDPFGEDEITVVKAISPDYSIIHVQECDSNGNAIIKGATYDDILLSKASKNIIITTEKLISKAQIKLNFEKVSIPGLLVSAVVVVPKGAKPCSCDRCYDIDKNKIKEFLSIKNNDGLENFLNHYDKDDRNNQINISRY